VFRLKLEVDRDNHVDNRIEDPREMIFNSMKIFYKNFLLEQNSDKMKRRKIEYEMHDRNEILAMLKE
jgi:hypothetical protein